MDHGATPLDADRDEALAWLRAKRRHVAESFVGLSEDAARRPVLPSGWAPLAVVRHLTLDVERWWFARVVAGLDVELPTGPEGWALPADVSVAGVLEAYESECARSDEIVVATASDARVRFDDDGAVPHATLREVLLHVLVETATHAGHLDAARELLDGRQRLVLD